MTTKSSLSSFPRTEILKQTVQKTLQNTSISTEKGTVILNEIYANQLQSAISVRLPEELCDGYDLELRGTDSNGNNVRYELTDLLDYNGPHWNFKTGFWGAYEPEVRENAITPKPALPDPDSDYGELQLYLKSNVFSLDDVGKMMDDDSSSELSETKFFEQADTDPFGTETDFVLEHSSAQDESKGFGMSDDENDYGWEKIGEKVRIPLK